MKFYPVPKPNHGRNKPKRKAKTNFSSKTIREIFERDEWRCVRCGSYHLESVPHHVIFRSGMGEGSKRNGVSICIDCHKLAHSNKEIRYWFVNWVNEHLDEQGNRKQGV